MKKPKFRITTFAYHHIVQKLGSSVPEQGGILMGKNGIVTDFIHDEFAETTGSTYSLNVAYLNPIIKELKLQGKQLLGIIHSHPNGYSKLSDPDRDYFSSQFKNFPDLEFMYTPIVFSAKQREFEIFPYIFHKNGSIEKTELEVIPNDYEDYTTKEKKAEVDTEKTDSASDNQNPELPPILDAETVEDRKRIFVNIRQHIAIPKVEAEQVLSTKMASLMLILSWVHFFILGVLAGVLHIAVLYLVKNHIDFSKLADYFSL